MNDQELMKKLLEEDEAFRKTYKAHRDYEKRVAKMENRPHLSEDEKIEKDRLKKLKLKLKDEMETMLSARRKGFAAKGAPKEENRALSGLA
ncbi:MAG: DUF465 domain-containing protein [Deltaproteobacteria bacterium]|nr:DUF465 domain-containing protein [Deltaproteobacteria bacterium]